MPGGRSSGGSQKRRTRPSSAASGRPFTVAAHPTRSGRRPKRAKTFPSRAGPGRSPLSTRQPAAPPGCNAADGAVIPLAPAWREAAAACWQAGPAAPVPGHGRVRQPRPIRRLVADLDGPERPSNLRQIRRIDDVLVTKELGPCAVRRIAEILRQLAFRVPSSGRLVGVFPQKGKPAVAMPERDHVAGDALKESASSRTRIGPSSSGRHSRPRVCAGVLPASALRGRSNQRRTPASV